MRRGILLALGAVAAAAAGGGLAITGRRWRSSTAALVFRLLAEAETKAPRPSPRATISAGDGTVSVDFHSAADGLVDRIYTALRERDVGGGRTVLRRGRGGSHTMRCEAAIGSRCAARWNGS